jgi:Tfp pilus assembly protein PilZ
VLDRGRFSGDYFPVLDISRGGAKFVCSHRVRPGTSIVLLLSIPGLDEAIEIQGVIRWTNRNPEQSYRFQVGVAFSPYGKKKNENPPEVLEKLRQLEADCSSSQAARLDLNRGGQ